MFRSLCLATLSLLAAGQVRAFEEPATSDMHLAEIIDQLETGDWNARIHAVHELAYMQALGLDGLALATEDGDWQVRMAAVHAIGPLGSEGAPLLFKLLKHEPCPVVRLMTLHNLGSLGPEGEEAKAMGQISDGSSKEINCRDQPGPGRTPWGRARRPKNLIPVRPAAARAPVSAKPPRAKEALPAPTKIQRRAELDALLDLSTAAVSRRGVSPEMRGRSTGTPETLPWPVAPVPREHGVSAPGLIMKDAGGAKTPHDALPALLRALKHGDVRTRSRAADDLGQLGATAVPAAAALMEALRDRSARVRSSASLALGNIGSKHEGVVPLLTDALKDRSEDVRYAAAVALSRIDTPEARAAFNRHVDKEARRAIDRPKEKSRRKR